MPNRLLIKKLPIMKFKIASNNKLLYGDYRILNAIDKNRSLPIFYNTSIIGKMDSYTVQNDILLIDVFINGIGLYDLIVSGMLLLEEDAYGDSYINDKMIRKRNISSIAGFFARESSKYHGINRWN